MVDTYPAKTKTWLSHHHFFIPYFVSSVFFTPTGTAQNCPSSCPGSTDDLKIRFPFGLNDTSNNLCSHPGFTISCNSQNRTILTLPNSAQFTVQQIDYYARIITITDPNSCIPGRFLDGSFHQSGYPFRAYANVYDNLSFFNCSPGMVRGLGSSAVKRIPCLSGPNYTIVVARQDPYYPYDLSLCPIIKRVTVPDWWWFDPEPMDGLTLEWVMPNCLSCEGRGGTCGFKSHQSLKIGCFGAPREGHRLPRGAKYGIIISVGNPGLLCLIGLFFHISERVNNTYTHQRQHPTPTAELSTSIASQPAIMAARLDRPTIESYPKALLGESRRLPNPNDFTCPLCFSEYQPKDALRAIPECEHYFHADCIDKWLRMNNTCPLCRNSTGSVSTTPSSSLSSSSSPLLSIVS